MNDLMIYLKTTDTCQLDCDHCFTDGKNGKKGWFNVSKTIDFLHRLHEYHPKYDYGSICFHGGEPMLAPTEMLFDVWNNTKHLWPNLDWSVQTNLTYPLTNKKVSVFETICDKSIGTSWDKGIRWPDINKELQWERNVKQLTDDGFTITVIVCLTSGVVEMEPIDILNKMASLGVKHINFERLTSTGTAIQHPELFPGNKKLDEWFLKLWEQSVEHRTYEYIDITFFDSILTSLVYNTHSGCRCRQCEQKVLTINADGSVGGCPNGAVSKTFGTIDDDIHSLMTSDGRICNIQAEAIRPPGCWNCPVFNMCNGDCYQLSWEGKVCAAPKSLMMKLKQEQNVELYKRVLGDFMGQE